jgi:uncharacterized protein
MRWEGRSESGNVEDRRGMGGGGMRLGLPVGGGIGGVVLLLLFSALTGQNPLDLIGGSTDQGSYSEPDPNAPPATDPQSRFMRVVLKDTEDTWTSIFQNNGQRYEEPTLVLFAGSTDTACGLGESAVGPFYCPGDRKVYLDTSFFDELDQRFGAPGDFAQAYVIAHEIGHHVQNLLGLSERVQGARQRAGRAEGNALSVRLELQADCYAGVWAASVYARGVLDPGDIDEALTAAEAVGDDRIQQQTQGRIDPETFTHGTSEQRARWFRTGFDSGDPTACDTFNNDI